MAISQQFVGNVSTGNTSINPTVPSQCGAGSLLLLVLASKDEDAPIVFGPPAGWELLTSNDGGGSAHGQVRLTVWWRVPTVSLAGQSVQVRIQDTNENDEVAGFIVGYTKSATDGAWVTPPRFVTAEDSTDNGTFSVSFSNLNLQAGSVSAVLSAISDSGGTRGSITRSIPGTSLTQTAGAGYPSSSAMFTQQTGSNSYLSVWERSWHRTSSAPASGSPPGATTLLYQGKPSGYPLHYSKCAFNKSQIMSDLADKTVTGCQLRLKCLHSWYQTGLDPGRFGTHNTVNDPGTGGNTTGHFNEIQANFKRGQIRTLNCPLEWGKRFQSGAIAGITFGRTGQGGLSDYGYFEGSGSDRPRLTIHWSKTVVKENPVSVWRDSAKISSGSQSGNASYSISVSGGTMSGMAVQVAIETVVNETITISDSFSTVEQPGDDTIKFRELASLPGDRAVPGADTMNFIEFAVDLEGVAVTDQDTIHIHELDNPPLDEFSVRFNENPNNPGFIITLKGLLGIEQQYDMIDVFRRDTSGRYPDRRVRGLAQIVPEENEMTVVDYEAPLCTELEYYVRLFQGNDFFDFGPAIPTPDPFIPVQSTVYGEGLAYFKPIDIPSIGIPVMIEEFNQWSRPARIQAEHEVLGRRNKVVITDVRGGREGDISGWIILSRGQSLKVFEAVINPGAVILIQNTNPAISGIDDLYVQLGDVTFTRINKMARHGMHLNPNFTHDVIIRFEADYTEVDRPNPIGVVLLKDTWQTVKDTFTNWDSVKDNRETWLELLKRPNGPDA